MFDGMLTKKHASSETAYCILLWATAPTGGHIKKTSLAQQEPRYLWYSPLTVFLNGRGVP